MYLEDYGISFIWSIYQTKTLQELARIISKNRSNNDPYSSWPVVYCCWHSKSLGNWLLHVKRGKWSIQKSVSVVSSKEIILLQRSNYNVVREGPYYFVRGKR